MEVPHTSQCYPNAALQKPIGHYGYHSKTDNLYALITTPIRLFVTGAVTPVHDAQQLTVLTLHQWALWTLATHAIDSLLARRRIALTR